MAFWHLLLDSLQHACHISFLQKWADAGWEVLEKLQVLCGQGDGSISILISEPYLLFLFTALLKGAKWLRRAGGETASHPEQIMLKWKECEGVGGRRGQLWEATFLKNGQFLSFVLNELPLNAFFDSPSDFT